MIVQGSGLHTSIQAKSKCNLHKGEQKKISEQKCDTVEISNNGLDRSELLRKIRNKVESGFYNSDSVLEDISHGFAKALDPL